MDEYLAVDSGGDTSVLSNYSMAESFLETAYRSVMIFRIVYINLSSYFILFFVHVCMLYFKVAAATVTRYGFRRV